MKLSGAQVVNSMHALEPNSEPPADVQIVDFDIAAEVSNDVRNEKITDRSQTLT